MANITRKHIVFSVTYNETDYQIYIPFLRYEMFRDIHLVFNYVYEMISKNRLDPMTFCTDLYAYFDVAVEQNYPNSNKDEKIKSIDSFFNQSLLGAYVLDTKKNYEPVMLDKFMQNMSDEDKEEFLIEIKGFYCFFYATQRYLRNKVEMMFSDSYTSLSVTEYQKYFMKSLSQETSCETENTQESSVSAKTIDLANMA